MSISLLLHRSNNCALALVSGPRTRGTAMRPELVKEAMRAEDEGIVRLRLSRGVGTRPAT
jgi:hypothetical protein